jgi:hypothetical protein
VHPPAVAHAGIVGSCKLTTLPETAISIPAAESTENVGGDKGVFTTDVVDGAKSPFMMAPEISGLPLGTVQAKFTFPT